MRLETGEDGARFEGEVRAPNYLGNEWTYRNLQPQPITGLSNHGQQQGTASGEAHYLWEDVSDWILIEDLTDNCVMDLMRHSQPHAQEGSEEGPMRPAPGSLGTAFHGITLGASRSQRRSMKIALSRPD